MILGEVIQQPADRVDYDFDASPMFNGDSDSILSVAVTATPAGLNVLASKGGEDHIAKVWVDGGVDGTTYTVELTITSTQGRIKQDELIVVIEEFV